MLYNSVEINNYLFLIFSSCRNCIKLEFVKLLYYCYIIFYLKFIPIETTKRICFLICQTLILGKSVILLYKYLNLN